MSKVWTSNLLSRRLLGQLCFSSRLSTATQVSPEETKTFNFRTAESSPSKQTKNHLGLYYTVPSDIVNRFSNYAIPKSFEIQTKTFVETCIMIRYPALDVINCLKSIDYSRPAVRFMLYGKIGTGKSITLFHIMHYGIENDFILVHAPWPAYWLRANKESANSVMREGYVDLPIDSAAWLVYFKQLNKNLLDNPDLIISKDYVWSKREVTPKGAHITELLDHGVNRIKFASECIVALAHELKLLSTQGKCKTLVCVDGFNALYYPKTKCYWDAKTAVPPNKVTIVEAFMELTKFDWCNGAVVVSIDKLAVSENPEETHLPWSLMGKQGFEHFDPFVPVKVEDYTEKEFLSCMEYYRDRMWITSRGNPDEQNKELEFLSGKNPYQLMSLTAPL